MRENWVRHRDVFIENAHARYAQMLADGTGLCSEDAKERKREANKWIMKRANDAMHAETNYDETYTEVQARIRREQPFIGEANGGDYYEYCSWLGTQVVTSPECREIADAFMAEAIPRFAAEWNARKELLAA